MPPIGHRIIPYTQDCVVVCRGKPKWLPEGAGQVNPWRALVELVEHSGASYDKTWSISSTLVVYRQHSSSSGAARHQRGRSLPRRPCPRPPAQNAAMGARTRCAASPAARWTTHCRASVQLHRARHVLRRQRGISMQSPTCSTLELRSLVLKRPKYIRSV